MLDSKSSQTGSFKAGSFRFVSPYAWVPSLAKCTLAATPQYHFGIAIAPFPNRLRVPITGACESFANSCQDSVTVVRHSPERVATMGGTMHKCHSQPSGNSNLDAKAQVGSSTPNGPCLKRIGCSERLGTVSFLSKAQVPWRRLDVRRQRGVTPGV